MIERKTLQERMLGKREPNLLFGVIGLVFPGVLFFFGVVGVLSIANGSTEASAWIVAIVGLGGGLITVAGSLSHIFFSLLATAQRKKSLDEEAR